MIVRSFGAKGQLEAEPSGSRSSPPALGASYLLPGLWGTLKAAAISIVLAGVLGLLLGVGRLSQNTLVRWVCGVLVEFFRAVPVLIMMIFRSAPTPSSCAGLRNDIERRSLAVVTALTLYNGVGDRRARSLRRLLPARRASVRPGCPSG